MLTSLSVNAQTINLRGKVSNQAGKPITNAILTLVGQGIKDTTGADGSFSIITTDVSVIPLLKPTNTTITMYKSFLDFSLLNSSPVKIEIFDVKGHLLKKISLTNAQTGFYRFDVAENARAEKLLVIRASIGQNGATFRYLPLNSGKYSVNPFVENSMSVGGTLAKITAISDTLKVTATGYTPKAVVINSYDKQLDITLDTAGGSGGAKPSPGCGKTPPFTGEKRVTVNAGSAGNRDYILRLPSDYDNSHPYPLFFAIHCMNGSADNVAHSEPDTREQYEYFGMWKFANPAAGKGTTIFCAPEGIGAAWGQGAKDLQFFRYMINKFETELCVDMSRIFAMGFSMGGSMSYALACAMPDTMRAIGMLAGGSMSGCDGSHRGPVPIFIAHGTSDPTCRWPGSGYTQLKDLAERDGCDPMDIPALVNQNPPADNMHPVCFEYKNCNPGYPCRACIHKGDHTGSPGTQGSWGKNNTWTDDSAWSYFKRFY